MCWLMVTFFCICMVYVPYPLDVFWGFLPWTQREDEVIFNWRFQLEVFHLGEAGENSLDQVLFQGNVYFISLCIFMSCCSYFMVLISLLDPLWLLSHVSRLSVLLGLVHCSLFFMFWQLLESSMHKRIPTYLSQAKNFWRDELYYDLVY